MKVLVRAPEGFQMNFFSMRVKIGVKSEEKGGVVWVGVGEVINIALS